MTIIRSAVLSFGRVAPRNFPTRFSSSASFPPAILQYMRQMATSESTKHHFAVYAPDNTDPEGLQRRLTHRPEHLARVETFVARGVFKVLGPTLTPESVLPGAEQKMNGSLFIVEASSIEEVKDIVESDAYYRGNVWDKEKLVITPMILVLPK